MPQDASRYGIGSRFAWKRYREERTKWKAGLYLNYVGAAGALGFGLGSLHPFLTDNDKLGYALVGVAGVCTVVWFVGLILSMNTDVNRAGMMVFATDEGKSVSMDVSPGGITMSGEF
jgi:hypothetical protein